MLKFKLLPGTRNRKTDENPRARCAHCGRGFHWSADNSDNPIYYDDTPGGNGWYICPSCYWDKFGYCNNCGRLRLYREMDHNNVCGRCSA